MTGRLRAAENLARLRGGESPRDDPAVERQTIDVHQQRGVFRAEFSHIGVEEIAVVDAGALALVDAIAEMREHVGLRLDDARVDVVPVERDDPVHQLSRRRARERRARHGRGAAVLTA